MNDRVIGYKSSVIETSTAVATGKGFVKRLLVQCGQTPDTITVYDNTAGGTAAAGTELFAANMGTGLANYELVVDIPLDLPFTTGLYVDFTGGSNQIDYVTIIYDTMYTYGS